MCIISSCGPAWAASRGRSPPARSTRAVVLSAGPDWAGVLAIAASLLIRRLRDALAQDTGADQGYCYVYQNGARYRFWIQRAGAGYRAYILESPPYRGMPEGFHATHRVRDAGGVYVCWDQVIPSAEAAEAVARLWADRTEDYIHTGALF